MRCVFSAARCDVALSTFTYLAVSAVSSLQNARYDSRVVGVELPNGVSVLSLRSRRFKETGMQIERDGHEVRSEAESREDVETKREREGEEERIKESREKNTGSKKVGSSEGFPLINNFLSLNEMIK